MLLAGSDGGAYVTLNADVISPTLPIWNQLNDSLNTIEFYSGDITGNFANVAQPRRQRRRAGQRLVGHHLERTPTHRPADVAAAHRAATASGRASSRCWASAGIRSNNSGHISGSAQPAPTALQLTLPAAGTADTRSFVLPYEIYKYDCPPTGCTHMIAGTNRVWETITGGARVLAGSPISPNLTKGTLGDRSYINQLSYAVSLSTTAIVGTNDGNVQYGFGLGQGANGAPGSTSPAATPCCPTARSSTWRPTRSTR